MKIRIVIGLLFFTLLSPVNSQKEDLKEDDNGYTWNYFESSGKKLSKPYKIGIITGYIIACKVVHGVCELEEIEDKSYLCSLMKVPTLKIGDWINGLDKFYSDYANKKIPIYFAFEYISQRVSGISEDSLTKFLESSRRIYSK